MTIAPKRYALALGAGVVALAIAGGPAIAEMPKKGGVLNFVVGSRIPTYDGHRESTFGMIHPIRPVLQSADPGESRTIRSPPPTTCATSARGRIPSPTNDGKTYTFAIRQDVKFHDGTPLTAHDIKATYDKIIFPPEGIISSPPAAVQHGGERRGSGRPHHRLQPEVPVRGVHPGPCLSRSTSSSRRRTSNARIRKARRPALRHEVAPDQHQRDGRLQVRAAPAGGVRRGGPLRRLPPRGQAAPRRLQGDRGPEDGGADQRHPRRPGRHRVPGLRAEAARRSRGRARGPDHGAGERLELPAPHLHQPQEAPVRRRAGAPGPHACGGPLVGVGAALPDCDRQDGGRNRVSEPRARHRRGNPQDLRRLLAGHRRGTSGGEAAPQGGGRREPHLRSAQPHGRHAVPDPRHVAHRGVEEDRGGGHPGRRRDQRVVREAPGRSDHDLGIDANCQSVINPVADVGKYTSRSANPANYSHYEDAESWTSMHDQLAAEPATRPSRRGSCGRSRSGSSTTRLATE